MSGKSGKGAAARGRVLLLLLLPVLFLTAGGCSSYPGYQERIRNMKKTIDTYGYRTRNRPDNAKRYENRTETLRDGRR